MCKTFKEDIFTIRICRVFNKMIDNIFIFDNNIGEGIDIDYDTTNGKILSIDKINRGDLI